MKVLYGISAEVSEGELVTLLGPNGAGKSTLVKTISGLLKPGSGSIVFAGHRLNVMGADAIIRLGLSRCPEEK